MVQVAPDEARIVDVGGVYRVPLRVQLDEEEGHVFDGKALYINLELLRRGRPDPKRAPATVRAWWTESTVDILITAGAIVPAVVFNDHKEEVMERWVSRAKQLAPSLAKSRYPAGYDRFCKELQAGTEEVMAWVGTLVTD